MPSFVEALAKQQLWYWLDTEKGWLVEGEVNTTNGRIDLAARTPDGRYVGIELKAALKLQFGSTLPEQVQRYIDSEQFDEIYYAGPRVKAVSEAVESDDKTPSVQVVREACKSLSAGIEANWYGKHEVVDQIERGVSNYILSYEYSYDDRKILDYIERKITNTSLTTSKPISIEAGVKQINNSVFSDHLGVIKVPLPLQGGYLRSPRMALTPGEVHEPEIILEPTSVTRSGKPEFNRTGEPWIRHCVWREFGGIPEGHIPNVMETEMADRPIDVLAFEGDWDPSKIVQGDVDGEVIGVEAKGENGVSSARTTAQLREFIETGVLSRLYLAVPDAARKKAGTILENSPTLTDSVGILTVDDSGSVETVRHATGLDLKHDGYRHRGETYKTGYADVTIPSGEDVQSPFDLAEWRDPLTDDLGRPVIWEQDPRQFVSIVDSVEELTLSNPRKTREELKQYTDNRNKFRAYLLKGLCAAPYAKGKPHERAPKKGFTRLTITEFETDDDEYGLELHFGGGSWKGGYVCLVGVQVDDFETVLASIDNIEETTIIGQGRVIDLEGFDFTFGDNYEHSLGGDEARPEELLPLCIRAAEPGNGAGARLELGEGAHLGVDVAMTETQRLDLLRTIRVARFGRPSEIPGGSGYQRVGADGGDTWEKGTSIEKRHQPDLV